MEIKERYALNYDAYGDIDCVLDLERDLELDLIEVKRLLNEQDEKIKKLVSKLRVSNNQLASSQLEYKKLKEDYNKQEKLLSSKLASNSKLQLELDTLQQSQNQKAIEVLEKALELACRELMPYRFNICGGLYTTYELEDKIQTFKQKAKEIVDNEFKK